MKDAIARLICFLVGHDLQLYRLACRNHFRLVCRWCQHPYGDTLNEVWQRLLQRAKTHQEDCNEAPF